MDDIIARIQELTDAALREYTAIVEEQARLEERKRALVEAFPLLRKHLKLTNPKSGPRKVSEPEVLFDAEEAEADDETTATAKRLLMAGVRQKKVAKTVHKSNAWVTNLAKELGAQGKARTLTKYANGTNGHNGRRKREPKENPEGALLMTNGRVFKPSGTTLRVLNILRERGEVQAPELAKLAKVTPPEVHSSGNTMARYGLTERKEISGPNKQGRTVKIILWKITEKGKEYQP